MFLLDFVFRPSSVYSEPKFNNFLISWFLPRFKDTRKALCMTLSIERLTAYCFLHAVDCGRRTIFSICSRIRLLPVRNHSISHFPTISSRPFLFPPGTESRLPWNRKKTFFEKQCSPMLHLSRQPWWLSGGKRESPCCLDKLVRLSTTEVYFSLWLTCVTKLIDESMVRPVTLILFL